MAVHLIFALMMLFAMIILTIDGFRNKKPAWVIALAILSAILNLVVILRST